MAFRSLCCILLLRFLTTTAGQVPVRTSGTVETPPPPPAAARRRLRAIDETDIAAAYVAAAAAAVSSPLDSRADEYAAEAAPDGYHYWPLTHDATSALRSMMNAQQRLQPLIAAAQATQEENGYDTNVKSSGVEAEVQSDSRFIRRQGENNLPRLLLKLIRPAGGLGSASFAPKRALLGAANTRSAASPSAVSSAARRACATSDRRCQSLCSQRSPLLTSWVMILSGC